MLQLTRERLERLRDRLRARGQRPSIVVGPLSSQQLVEAMMIVQEWGAFTEAMYLIMAADGRVVSAELEVLRGALSVLSGGMIRTIHMESMLDSSAKRLASEGLDARLQKIIRMLKDDPARADLAVLLAEAIATADEPIMESEQRVMNTLQEGLGVTESRLDEQLASLEGNLADASQSTPHIKL